MAERGACSPGGVREKGGRRAKHCGKGSKRVMLYI